MNESLKRTVVYLILGKNTFTRARCPQNDSKTKGNPRACTLTHSGRGAYLITQTRSNASFVELEEQEAWKREGGFDRVEIIAEMHAHTLRLDAGFDSEPLYTGL